jgi:hypothetical protein
MTKSTFSIDISSQKDVTPSGERISKTTWDAQATQSRDAEIELARQLALEQQQQEQELANPVNVRLARLEGQVARQHESIQMLLKLLGRSDDQLGKQDG